MFNGLTALQITGAPTLQYQLELLSRRFSSQWLFFFAIIGCYNLLFALQPNNNFYIYHQTQESHKCNL